MSRTHATATAEAWALNVDSEELAQPVAAADEQFEVGGPPADIACVSGVC